MENNNKTIYSIFLFKLKSRSNYQWKRHSWFICIILYSNIVSNILISLSKGSGWIIDSVLDHNINISKYNPLAVISNY